MTAVAWPTEVVNTTSVMHRPNDVGERHLPSAAGEPRAKCGPLVLAGQPIARGRCVQLDGEVHTLRYDPNVEVGLVPDDPCEGLSIPFCHEARRFLLVSPRPRASVTGEREQPQAPRNWQVRERCNAEVERTDPFQEVIPPAADRPTMDEPRPDGKAQQDHQRPCEPSGATGLPLSPRRRMPCTTAHTRNRNADCRHTTENGTYLRRYEKRSGR